MGLVIQELKSSDDNLGQSTLYDFIKLLDTQ